MEIQSKHKLLHIVAVPCPAQSHISALMHLCKRLSADLEILISFVNVDSIHEQMQKHSTRTRPENIRLEQIKFDWKIPTGYDAYCAANKGLFAECSEKQLTKELSKLIHRLNSKLHHPVGCIISDYFCPWTQQVADEFQIPRAVFWSGSASWACIEYHVPELFAKKHIFWKDPEDCSVDYVGGLPPIPRSCMPLHLSNHKDVLWRDHSLKRSYTLIQAAWVLVNSLPALEKQAFEFLKQTAGSHKLLPVGPLFLLGRSASNQEDSNSNEVAGNVLLRAEDDECLAWLDKQQPRSVLYISFGSIAVLSKAEFEELAKALQTTRIPFVWVIRPEFMLEAGLSDEAYESFRSGFREQGLMVSWAPQLQVLGHSSVGGFLTHCGWNSVLESMSFGVPMIGWPWAGEQNTNCRLMADEWKLGAALSGNRREGLIIESEEIHRTIELVMVSDEGAELRSRVKIMSARCREAVKAADHQLAIFLSNVKAGKF